MAGKAARAVQEFLDEVADELAVISTWHTGVHHRKVRELEAKVRAFDGTASSAKELLEGDSAD